MVVGNDVAAALEGGFFTEGVLVRVRTVGVDGVLVACAGEHRRLCEQPAQAAVSVVANAPAAADCSCNLVAASSAASGAAPTARRIIARALERCSATAGTWVACSLNSTQLNSHRLGLTQFSSTELSTATVPF